MCRRVCLVADDVATRVVILLALQALFKSKTSFPMAPPQSPEAARSLQSPQGLHLQELIELAPRITHPLSGPTRPLVPCGSQ